MSSAGTGPVATVDAEAAANGGQSWTLRIYVGRGWRGSQATESLDTFYPREKVVMRPWP